MWISEGFDADISFSVGHSLLQNKMGHINVNKNGNPIHQNLVKWGLKYEKRKKIFLSLKSNLVSWADLSLFDFQHLLKLWSMQKNHTLFALCLDNT